MLLIMCPKTLSIKERAKKADRLKNSRDIDFWWYSTHYISQRLIDYIWFDMVKHARRSVLQLISGIPSNAGYGVKTGLEPILCDLFLRWSQDPNGYLSISRKAEHYKQNRYHKKGMSYRISNRIFNFLIDHDYVEYHKGYRNPNNKNDAHRSKIKSNDKLIVLYKQFGLKPKYLKRHPDEEIIILNDSSGNKIDYRDTFTTLGQRVFLHKYNAMLEGSNLDLHLTKNERKELSSRMNIFDVRVRRVFSRGSFKHGGRLYSKYWTNIDKIFRKQITVNGNAVCELDYRALHPTILYVKAGANVPTTDPYKISGYTKDKDTRKFFKILLNCMINGSSQEEVRQVIQHSIYKNINHSDGTSSPKIKQPNWLKGTSKTDMYPVIDAVEKHHKPINKYFFSDIGIELQYLDSEMAMRVLHHFMDNDLVLLPEHDSFIVERHNKNELRSTMVDAFKHVMGTKQVIQIDQKY